MRRILVCGGRDYDDRPRVFATLDELRAEHGDFVTIHGGADGADTLAGEWARARALPYWVFPADWRRYRRRAGPLRNEQMLRVSAPSLAVVFPGGRGTRHMFQLLTERGVPCLTIPRS